MTLPLKRVVADTSVVSHMFRLDRIGILYGELLSESEIVISFQTLGEQLYGAYNNNWGPRRLAQLNSYLTRYPVIWPDDELVDVYARPLVDCGALGWTIDSADAWIAATAKRLNCPLATMDHDFDGVPNLTLVPPVAT